MVRTLVNLINILLRSRANENDVKVVWLQQSRLLVLA